ncbi:flagellar basal body-associated protein FliL [Metabacillus sp. GX 13764]|uniref:flagellar basal body-associated protein FliL n=1 Tax=Metabacillus kandeliae TaxID=2900151 RepID=UPI001E29B85D|nr:flagellar basal body-associated protein FliL [Metabacillus kandeliae]MCD7033773.1 flagellar basal body-associated protein FliL [Metabacillus kandeliae]
MTKKLLTVMLVIITAITLIGVTALVVYMNVFNQKEGGPPTIDQVIEMSVDVPEITTNVEDENIVRMALKLETNSKKGKAELEKRLFQVNDLVISELSNMKVSQLEGKKGMEQLKSVIAKRTNALMKDGKVEKVYVTSFIMQ